MAKQRPMNRITHDVVVANYLRGVPVKTIARDAGVNVKTIERILIKKGVERMAVSPNGENPDKSKIPPDLVWDENDPPYVHECTHHLEHDEDCDGNCGGKYLDESYTALVNEHLAWARADMLPQGYPASMTHLPFTNGIPVEMFDLEKRQQALQQLLMDNGLIDGDELDVKFREMKVDHLRRIREANEERLRKQRVADQFGIVERKVLGPDGKPLG